MWWVAAVSNVHTSLFCALRATPDRSCGKGGIGTPDEMRAYPVETSLSSASLAVPPEPEPFLSAIAFLRIFFFFCVNTRMHLAVWRGPAKLGELAVDT